ncbi:MAG: Xaa-Pro peptidase family protein [Clostridia bacterium]|jgi:Xaa-Pro aminopeptidase|nr:Xaa-Pro peptidase family protein [Clostridia bacterium]MDH7573437.1 Xaa-Pro peptidase family protein [Clostridia bacterium]
MVPAAELARRIESFQVELRAAEVDAALLLQKVDYYYFSGTMQLSYLYIPAEGEPLLMVVRDWDRARNESALANVVPCPSVRQAPVLIQAQQGRLPASLGLEFDVLPVKEYFRIQKLFPGVRLTDVSGLIHRVRSRKSSWEVGQMLQAAALAAEVYAAVPRLLRPGMTEIELAGLLEAEAKKRGHEGLLRMRSLNYEAYTWHILSGASGGVVSYLDGPVGGQGLSPAFPVGAGRKPIEAGEPILVDFGGVVNGYQVDETRMYCLGRMPDKFRRAYEACLEIERTVLEAARPGVSCHYLFGLARATAEKLGYEDAFLGPKGKKVRFVGHGIGLEINEPPYLAEGHDYPLEAGMTFALEPKMVFPGEGAVGIEDTVVVEANGCRRLTDMPDGIIEIEP